MPRDRIISGWLIAVVLLIVTTIIYGGWVRITRSGLSIVEWNVVSGVVPPLNAAGWDAEFAKYRSTPEYQKVNAGMSLSEFKDIYYREYNHRLLGRIAGLAFVVPLVVFLIQGRLPRQRIPLLLGIGLLFAVQGLIGWLMVKSGLTDQPQVSHHRLVLHLLAALALLAACLWLTFDYVAARGSPGNGVSLPGLRRLAWATLAAVVLQIAFGALLAGLKAGHLSDTFPKMLGQWLPEGLLRQDGLIANLLENPLTVHFQHRWFGFATAGVALALFLGARRESGAGRLPPRVRKSIAGVVHLILLQVVAGVLLVVWNVPPHLASLHQAIAVAIFGLALFVVHQLQPDCPAQINA